MVQREFAAVRLIGAGRNLGFGTAANLGGRATKRDMVLFLNPDTAIKPGSVATLARGLRRDERAGVRRAQDRDGIRPRRPRQRSEPTPTRSAPSST